MGTKNDPQPNDCYTKALPDEPMFVLIGRDAIAPELVRGLVNLRMRFDPGAALKDADTFAEAIRCADAMAAWRMREMERAVPRWRLPRVHDSYDYDARSIVRDALAHAIPVDVFDDCGLAPDLQNIVDAVAVTLRRLAREEGRTCEDEGCPHFGTPHSHVE